MISAAAALLTIGFASQRSRPSDFAQVWAAARGLIHGQNPYLVVGPGREFDWPFPLLYPLTAVTVAVPFAPLSMSIVDPLFVAISTFALAWSLTRGRLNNPQLAVFGSMAFVLVIQTSQWSPLLCAAALMPTMGFLLASKPSLGVALSVAFPSLRLVVGTVVFVFVTLIIWPTWWHDWFATFPAATHITELVRQPGGFLVLLVLLRWRRPEARLLAAMACIPQTPLVYEAVPLFLAVECWWEGVTLASLTMAYEFLLDINAPYGSYNERMARSAVLMLWCLYIPTALMVLRRENIAQNDLFRWFPLSRVRLNAPEQEL
jgi:hypothetical protein